MRIPRLPARDDTRLFVACRLSPVAGRQSPEKQKDRQAEPGGLLRFYIQHSDRKNSRSVSFAIERNPVGFAETLQERVDLHRARE